MSTSTVTPPPGYTVDPSDVTIDMSTAKPIPPAGYTIDPSDVTIDMSTARPINPAMDKDFMAASPDDQVKYLSSQDPNFARASKADQLAYINHLKGTAQPDNQPVQAGEQLNDVGNKVITPKDGEDFSATVQRAVKLGKARQAAGTEQSVINKETATIPSKTAQTLGTAAAAGIAGPAALALPGEIGTSLASMTSAVKAVGAWAEAHPVHAYLVFQALKELIPGAKKATAIIKGVPGE